MNVSAADLAVVQRILREHLPGVEVRAFGSRVRGDNRPYSDLDLVVMGEEKLPWAQRGRLVYELAEARVPFRVDVVEWPLLDAESRENVLEAWECVQAGAE